MICNLLESSKNLLVGQMQNALVLSDRELCGNCAKTEGMCLCHMLGMLESNAIFMQDLGFVFQGRFLYECILLRKGIRGCSWTSGECTSMGTSPYINTTFYFLASFQFHKKEIFPWEHMKFGELRWHNTLAFFCWGRSLKIHIKIKRELFMN